MSDDTGVTFNCSHCQQPLEADFEMGGETIRCPKCQQSIKVPSARVKMRQVGVSAASVSPPRPEPKKDMAAPACGSPANSKEKVKHAGRCPACSASIRSDAVICIQCGTDFRTGERMQSRLSQAPSGAGGIASEEDHSRSSVRPGVGLIAPRVPDARRSPPWWLTVLAMWFGRAWKLSTLIIVIVFNDIVMGWLEHIGAVGVLALCVSCIVGLALLPASRVKDKLAPVAWPLLFIVAACYAYSFFLAPSRVTLMTYEQIRSGMNLFRVDSKLGTGRLRLISRDVFEAMAWSKETKGDEMLNEFEQDSRGDVESILSQTSSDTGTGKTVSPGKMSRSDAMGLVAASAEREIVSKEGRRKPDGTFVPAKRATLRASTMRVGMMHKVETSAGYEFHEYVVDLTVNGARCKLIRNGVVQFIGPEPVGAFESWRGRNGRLITVLFTRDGAAYWSYQGPAEDFSGLPPQFQDQRPAVNAASSVVLPDASQGGAPTPLGPVALPTPTASVKNADPLPRPEASPQTKTALRTEKTLDLGGGVKMEFVLIRSGSFRMGSENGRGDEKPAHNVTITKPFYMGKYEVTQEQWQQVMGGNPSQFKGAKNPVERVYWWDCQDFVAKLSAKFRGGKFRLPTEAEWEYACRAGCVGDLCNGRSEDDLLEYGWFDINANETTHPVGEKKSNAWGLYDMHGNVWEWCSDWYGQYPANARAETDPVGPGGGTCRVVRGRSWTHFAPSLHSAVRVKAEPGEQCSYVGVRVVREAGDR